MSNKYQSCITILIIKYRVLQWKYGFGQSFAYVYSRFLYACLVLHRDTYNVVDRAMDFVILFQHIHHLRRSVDE